MQVIDLSQVQQSVKEYDQIIRGRLSNERLAEYYTEMADILRAEGDEDKAHVLANKAFSALCCHKGLTFGSFENQGVRDFKRTVRCHDKFCPICQKDVANSKEKRFAKPIKNAAAEYDLYNMTLTSINSRGNLLKVAVDDKRPLLVPEIKHMSVCFKKFIRYFSGNAKIKGLDFSQYGWAGALRSLEITFYVYQEYHQHYHVIMAMKKGLTFDGRIFNRFSRDNTGRRPDYYFSHFEIMLQKIWCLLLTNQKVTLANINALGHDDGYSVQFNRIDDGRFHQAFKYAIKPAKQNIMTFNVFQDLFNALHGMRTIQGYGIFHGLSCDDEIDESNDSVYDGLINNLTKNERPVEVMESPESVRVNMVAGKYIYISRRSVRAFVRRYGIDDEIELGFPPKPPEPEQLAMEYIRCKRESSLSFLDGGPGRKESRRIESPCPVISAPAAAVDYQDVIDVFGED